MLRKSMLAAGYANCTLRSLYLRLSLPEHPRISKMTALLAACRAERNLVCGRSKDFGNRMHALAVLRDCWGPET